MGYFVLRVASYLLLVVVDDVDDVIRFGSGLILCVFFCRQVESYLVAVAVVSLFH